MESIWWLFLIVVLIIMELMTMGLTTIWFAGGAVAAFIAALCGAALEVQIGLFVVVSFLLLFAFRPLAKRYLNANHTRTNVDSAIGAEALVTEEIRNDLGQGTAVLNGQEWTARSADGSVIEAGCRVRVEAVSGVKLMVLKEENGGKQE